MKGYGQFCPVARGAEIGAERWTPLVLRELFCGSRRFGDLHRGVPLMSRALLVKRPAELEDAGMVRSAPRPRGRGRECRLTAAGEELRPVIDRLGEWGQRWARAWVSRDDLDAGLLMWDIPRRLDLEALPPARAAVRFDFPGPPVTMRCPRAWWLVLARPDVDLCLKDPGFPVDVVVSADLRALTRVWMGDAPLAEALQAGSIRLDGPPALVRAFPAWLRPSSSAGVERARTAVAARPA